MLTFKQFLTEGGKATEKLGTVRASQGDVKSALKFVSKISGVPAETLANQLLGSTRLTFAGKQKDSGDVDIAINENEVDRDELIEKMTSATGNKPHVTGGTTYSFAVPVKDHKIQVDLMFVPDVEWAKFSHHASENSAYKSAVRNELLHSALKFSMEPGKDLRLKDEDGNDLVRASRAFKLDHGLERIFKIAPDRKDGKGRVKSVIKATPEQVQATLDALGHSGKFSSQPDIVRDPAKFAKMLFGSGTKVQDLESTEQLIALINKRKPEQAEKIFRDAVKGIKRLKFDVPKELQQYK